MSLYWHTLRRLPAQRLYARAWYKLYRPRPDTRPAPPARPVSGAYVAPIEGAPSLVAADGFRFLGVERRAPDWEPADVDQLWRYNLHYFDDLTAMAATTRSDWHVELLQRWVAENPPGRGTGWEPYPLSRRAVNWVKWDLRHRKLPPVCRESLAVQARWLMKRIEHHLGGNHLFSDAKALIHCGLYFCGTEAKGWYTRGMQLIAQQLPIQVLADGGHFERSTMYHAGALEDLLDLLNLFAAYGRTVPEAWPLKVASMLTWLRGMTHPDGDIAFFNDAAFKIAATAAQLQAYGRRLHLEQPPALGEPLHTLMPSGYVRALMGPAYLLCDCAPVGPEEQPGHAHADTLSFELSLGGRRVYVNSGTSCYGSGHERQRQRGTAAHNTVVVDGSDSSEVWAGFRVARRARARLLEVTVTPEAVAIEGSHDGYRRLPGSNIHTRRWQLTERSLRIQDRISGRFVRATAYFHIHPDLDVQLSREGEVTLDAVPGWSIRMLFKDASSIEAVNCTWHPQFGLAVPNRCVVVHFAAQTLDTHITWAPTT